ncbi:MAG: iron-containing alcohol dehydrogenase, partial [Clostridia bacterium]
PYVIKYNSKNKTALQRYAQIAKAVGICGNSDEELMEGLRKKINEFNTLLSIPKTLKEFGIIEEEFKEKLKAISENAVGDACTGSNPREIAPEQMAKLFNAIYYGEEIDF